MCCCASARISDTEHTLKSYIHPNIHTRHTYICTGIQNIHTFATLYVADVLQFVCTCEYMHMGMSYVRTTYIHGCIHAQTYIDTYTAHTRTKQHKRKRLTVSSASRTLRKGPSTANVTISASVFKPQTDAGIWNGKNETDQPRSR